MSNVGIYKITSPSGKIYIGQSWDIKSRMRRYKTIDIQKQPKLHNSFLKYGINEHEIKIIHELPPDVTQEIIDIYEEVYMEQYRDCGIELLNIREAGSRGKHSEETKLKLSIKNKGRGLGKKRPPRSEEWKMKQRLAHMGKKRSAESVEKSRLSRIGVKQSEETKRKRSETLKGVKHTEERRKNQSKSHRGQKASNAKKVICSVTGIVYPSIYHAAIANGVRPASISRCLSGVRKNNTSLKYFKDGG